ncbi:MAG TPA: hypothetical protein PKI20_10985 [Verrucomicrobiota bacterium]|nr:hypothetical protein [Verrucomicrobiota bacterium]HQL78116.1 hypothetical protein [Verrucomicrobiota bacterium]
MRFQAGSGIICAGLLLLAGALPLSARVGALPPSAQRAVQELAAIPQLILPATDVAAELAADRQKSAPAPQRFAVARPVAVTTATHGAWEQLPDGRLWRLRIVSAGATDLNLGFAAFWLPEGATLHIISESESSFQGPYTSRDNQPDGRLWTAVVPGAAAVVELFVPAQVQAQPEPQLLLAQVCTGYRDFCRKPKDSGTPKDAGACNNDVVCPVGVPWTNEIRSVAVYTINGVWKCTGTLVMTGAGDFRPFFLTANHCDLSVANAGTVVVYWNYQSPTCGTHGPGSLAQNQSGAIFRAAKYDVDFALLELTSIPDPAFQVYYSGWDRSGVAPSAGVGIHHPDSDVKSISISTTPLTTVDSCIATGGDNSHWHVLWSSGVTEHGSSGSGIWDTATHRLVGTLSGGSSVCGGSDQTDCYGKFSVAWASGGFPSDRLRDWLDPLETAGTSVPGADPMLTPVLALTGAALTNESCSPANGVIDPGETVTVSFTLKNFGGKSTTNLVASLLADPGVVLPGAPQYCGVLVSGGATTCSLTFTACGPCGGTIQPVLQLHDGGHRYPDATHIMGSGAVSFTLGAQVASAFYSENFDGMAVPALPANWTTSQDAWVTSNARHDSYPNCVFAHNAATVADYQLTSPPIPITSAGAQLTFRHYYDTEADYDGGVLEIAINGGAFDDILSAGGSFLSGGYVATLSSAYGNPLGGRSAWAGLSEWTTTTVLLPAAAAGGSVQLRWRLGTDSGTGGIGWYVDTIALSQVSYDCCGTRPVLMNPRRVPPAGFAFSYNSVAGKDYVVEARTPVVNSSWVPLQTNAGDCLPQSYTNSTSAASQLFFRVRLQ